MDRQFSLSTIAAKVGGNLHGDGNVTVRTVSTLEQADGDALSWIGNKEMTHRAESTKAGALLIPSDLAIALRIPTITVADPELALCTVLTLLAPDARPPFDGVDPRATIAPDASVDGAAIAAGAFVGPGARIGAGSVLYPGVFVGAECTIGTECTLWPNVVVRERCSLGDRVIVHPNATIGADGFGYLFRDGVHIKIPQIGRVVIEDDVEIGANTTIDRARSGETRIGRGTKIDNLVQIAHNCRVGEHCIFVAQSAMAGSSSLGHHVILAARAGVADHVDVGPGAQLAAGTGLFKNAPAGAKIGGLPGTDFLQHLKLQASLRRLPQLVQRLKDVEQRLAAMEESAASGATKASK